LKLTIERDHLVFALTPCAAVAPVRGTLPIVSCVLLSAKGKTLTASATDLICGVRRTCDAKTTEPGSVAVGAKDLLERVKTLPSGPVTMVGTTESLTVSSGKRKHVLHCQAPADMPPLPEPKTDGVKVAAGMFLSSLERAAVTASKDGTRPGMNAVAIDTHEGRLRMRAASNSGMGAVSVPLAVVVPKLLMPLESSLALRRVIDTEGDLFVSTDTARAYFISDRTLFVTALPSADHVPFDTFITIRDGLPCHATIERLPLISALRSVQLAAGRGELGGIVILKFTKGSLAIWAESVESNGNDELDVECETPGKVVVFAPQLLDALDACDDERVKFDFGQGVDPLFVTPEKVDTYLGIVMPLSEKGA